MVAPQLQKDIDAVSNISSNTLYSPSSPSFLSIESIEPPAPRFKLDDFDVLKHLSNGGSGKVFLVRHKETDEPLALKVISKKDKSEAALANVQAEQKVQAMLSVSNEGLYVPLVASWHDCSNYYLATEYCTGGDMALELMRCRRFEANRARFYMAELTIAVERLHARKIIHRDVKPANIIFDDNGHLLLGDFGVSKWFEDDDEPRFSATDLDANSGCDMLEKASNECSYMTTEDCGTPLFMSPEQHAGNEYSFPIDVWGMGVTLYRMTMGRMPFGSNEKDNHTIGECVVHDHLLFKDGDSVDDVTKDLLAKLLAKNPEDRPTIEQLKQHAYFGGIEWDVVTNREYEVPWAPFIQPLPKRARSVVPIEEGQPYRTNRDPFPEFTWHTPVFRLNVKQETSRSCKPFSVFTNCISGKRDVPRCRPLPPPVLSFRSDLSKSADNIAEKESLLGRIKRWFSCLFRMKRKEKRIEETV